MIFQDFHLLEQIACLISDSQTNATVLQIIHAYLISHQSKAPL